MNKGGSFNLKKIHKAIIIVFFLVLIVFAGIKIGMYYMTNGEGPTIKFDKDVVKVKTSADDDKLLEGVTATDSKGNDVTDSIIIEGYSKMLKGNKRKVTYIAYDSNNNVGKATRIVKYKNYKSPRIKAKESLEIYNEDGTINPLSVLTCKDSLDGNITNNIQLDSLSWISGNKKAKYSVDVSVTNSAGDTSSVTLPFIVHTVDSTATLPRVVLSDYIVYVKKGSKFNSSDYVKCLQVGNSLYQIQGKEKPKDTKTATVVDNVIVPQTAITKNSKVKINKKGVYKVTFKAKYNNETANTMMVVVVE